MDNNNNEAVAPENRFKIEDDNGISANKSWDDIKAVYTDFMAAYPEGYCEFVYADYRLAIDWSVDGQLRGFLTITNGEQTNWLYANQRYIDKSQPYGESDYRMQEGQLVMWMTCTFPGYDIPFNAREPDVQPGEYAERATFKTPSYVLSELETWQESLINKYHSYNRMVQNQA